MRGAGVHDMEARVRACVSVINMEMKRTFQAGLKLFVIFKFLQNLRTMYKK